MIYRLPSCFSPGDSIIKGTRRLFSVKYLFGEANVAQNYLLRKDG